MTSEERNIVNSVGIKNKLLTMLQMQEEVNIQTNGENWRDHNYPWYRAAWTECAELMDHVGWKWWREQKCDRDQAVLELVDIWHFVLCDQMQRSINNNSLSESIARIVIPFCDGGYGFSERRPTLSRLEGFAENILRKRSVPIFEFLALTMKMELSFDELYLYYITKNTLNKFRQENGYKEGTYTKIWHGMEDNQYLPAIVDDLKSRIKICGENVLESSDLSKLAYLRLEEGYPG